MTPDAFKAWRKSLGLKQKDAADKLGLKKRVIQYYEKGARDGKEIEIPKTVELACFALSMGVETYDGRQLPLRRERVAFVQAVEDLVEPGAHQVRLRQAHRARRCARSRTICTGAPGAAGSLAASS